MRKTFFLLTLTLVLALAAGSAWADAVIGLTTFTSGTPAIAASVNANFSEIQDSVDDNDTRITALEAPASRSFMLFPPDDGNSPSISMADGTTTSYSWDIAAPSDYVSDGAGDVTMTAIFSGGDDCSFSYRLSSTTDIFGTNGIGLIMVGPAPTQAIPNIAPGSPNFQYYMSNVSANRTGFGDVTYITFSRIGADSGDTCSGALLLRGVKVEYPAGQLINWFI